MQEKVIYLCRDGVTKTSTAYGVFNGQQYSLFKPIDDELQNLNYPRIEQFERVLVQLVANAMILAEEYGEEKAEQVKADPGKFKDIIMGLGDLYKKYNYPIQHVSAQWVKENIK